MILCTKAIESDARQMNEIARECGLHFDSARSLDTGSTEHWVARSRPAGSLLGFLSALALPDEFEVVDLAVRPEKRRRGVGSALLVELERRALQLEKRALFLEVRASNRAALELYRKTGFVVISERKNYYRTPLEDALCMRRELEPRGSNRAVSDAGRP